MKLFFKIFYFYIGALGLIMTAKATSNLKLTEKETVTLESYDSNASEWASTHHSKSFWEEELKTFKSYLSSGSLLEIGSGGGRDAHDLSNLYNYIGIDVSQGLLEEAKKNNPSASFMLASVYDLPFSENHFDGFWASASLLHIPKERADEALQEIRRVIKKNGIGFISLKEGEGEKVVDEKDRFSQPMNRLFSYYTEQEFKTVLEQNHFEVLEMKRRVDKNNTWLIYFVKVKK